MSQAKLEFNMWPHISTTFLPVTVVQIVDLSFCNSSFSSAPSHGSQLLLSITALHLVFGVMLLILALISTLKESVVLYRATKQWHPNCYVQQIVKDGILYFLAYVSPIQFQKFILPPIILSNACKKTNHPNF